MILQQQLPILLSLYWSSFVNLLHDLVYELVLSHAKGHLLFKLQRKIDFSELEKRCAAYHHELGPGAPATYGVESLVRALLLKYLYDLSLRELETRLYTDLLARWFAGYGLFDDLPDHVTLQRFETWVCQNCKRAFFDEILRQIDAEYPDDKLQIQIGDTYAMHANASREDLIPLLRHSSEQVLRTAVQTIPVQMERALCHFAWPDLIGRYKEITLFNLTLKERIARQATVVRAALDLHTRLVSTLQDRPVHELPELRLWLARLKKIINDNFIFEAESVRELPIKEKGDFRMGSASDPEASYRVHGSRAGQTSFGYNIQFAITSGGFVRETQAYTGASPDQAGVAELIEQQKEHQGYYPKKLIYDQAAGTGKTRAEVRAVSEGQTQLVAKLPPYEKRSGRYGPYDFSLSADGKTLCCPGGKSTSVVYRDRNRDGRDFRFFAYQCWRCEPPRHMNEADQAQRCPLWEKCRDLKQGPGARRRVFISNYRVEVRAAQEYNETEEFEVDLQQRPQVERVVFELTHYNGARHCRKRGLMNADWQAKMCAAAYNLKRWMRRLPA